MRKIYLGFAVADSMLPVGELVSKFAAGSDYSSTVPLRAGLQSGQVESCVNPSHQATINALKKRFNLDIPVPEKAPQVSLKAGDRMYVISVRGLPRLTDRHEYTDEEIERAEFVFSYYIIGTEACLDAIRDQAELYADKSLFGDKAEPRGRCPLCGNPEP